MIGLQLCLAEPRLSKESGRRSRGCGCKKWTAGLDKRDRERSRRQEMSQSYVALAAEIDSDSKKISIVDGRLRSSKQEVIKGVRNVTELSYSDVPRVTVIVL